MTNTLIYSANCKLQRKCSVVSTVPGAFSIKHSTFVSWTICLSAVTPITDRQEFNICEYCRAHSKCKLFLKIGNNNIVYQWHTLAYYTIVYNNYKIYYGTGPRFSSKFQLWIKFPIFRILNLIRFFYSLRWFVII